MSDMVEKLLESYLMLEKELRSFEETMIRCFGEFAKLVGLPFDWLVRTMFTAKLRTIGEIREDAELKKVIIDGEEINLFLEEPLIIGEAIAYAETIDVIRRLLRKAEIVEAKYGKEPRKLLVILTATSETSRQLKRIAEKEHVELIIGKTIG